MTPSLGDKFWNDFLALHALPVNYREMAEHWFMPLLDKVWQRRVHRAADKPSAPPLILGLQGCQGSGKTTFASLLQRGLGARANLEVLTLSLDDFYLTRAERLRLARDVHPLLATRGVPGTHDIAALAGVLRTLRGGGTCSLWVPRFDKARDDRSPEGDIVDPASLDVVILEGWCVGTPAQPVSALQEPVNELEALEDPGGAWRRRVNDQLAGPYAEAFGLLDYQIVFVAPDFSVVTEWRWEQERKLRAAAPLAPDSDQRYLTEEALHRFLQFYQRLTQWSFITMPERADICFHLGRDREIVSHSAAADF